MSRRKMTYDATQRLGAAARRVPRLLEREQMSDQRVADEERRHGNMLAKPAQRVARDATAAETAKKAKPNWPREAGRPL